MPNSPLPGLILTNLDLSIHKILAIESLPSSVWQSRFVSLSKTEVELSLVCESHIPIASAQTQKNWSCFRVMGILDFSLTGILNSIAEPLAKGGISIFALSTFDTDYILVKKDKIDAAINALKAHGFVIQKNS